MTLKGKTIFVTGGAGFIGSHFAETLAKQHAVVVYDNFTSNVVTAKDLTRFGVKRVVRGDIRDEKKLTASMRGSDIVVHFAVACVRLSLSQELFVHDVNTTGTLSALVSAGKNNIRRFVYISSSEVYGTTRGASISETHPITPTTVYGMSKYMGELYTKHFHDTENLPSVIVRPFNAYGPRSHFDGVYGEVIPRFAIRALNGEQPTIFGDGSQTRDFTYVTDTVAGIILAMQSDDLLGNAVNIAHGKEISVETVARTICSRTNLPYKPVMLPPRPHDVDRLAADTAKAEKILKYAPEISIEQGIASYIHWLKEAYPDSKGLLKKIPQTNW